jgi:hypothetical protein
MKKHQRYARGKGFFNSQDASVNGELRLVRVKNINKGEKSYLKLISL